MSSGEMEHQVIETPQTHTLRVAVFDFHSGELLSRHGESPLIRDEQPVDERGFPGIPHEQRAINIARRQFMGSLALKTMGRMISITDTKGTHHEAFAVKSSIPVPAILLRQSLYTGSVLKRRSLDEVYSKVHEAILDDPRSTNVVDSVDALILDEASKMFDELSEYRS